MALSTRVHGFYVLVLLISLLHHIAQSQVEISVLRDFYESTGGPYWKISWDFTNFSSFCDWDGIFCTLDRLNISGIYLPDKNLSGGVPSSFGDLSSLTLLDLSSNNITSIPNSIGNLVSLTHLSLAHNTMLSGEFLTEIPQNLEVLDLYGCNFSGLTLPNNTGNLVNLTNLELTNTQFIGGIPDLTRLTKLKNFYSRNTQFSSFDSMEYLHSLEHVDLYNNQLTIFPNVGNLPNLSSLVLAHNQLFGSIPSEIGSCSKMSYLDLQYNYLSGSIPPELGNLKQLTFLYVAAFIFFF